jgi:RNA polymerase sigma factor (sigma-70 family)
MVEENMGLAYFVLRKYSKRFEWLEKDDILSACFIGLIKASQTFNPERSRFSTYATTVMHHQIIKELIPRKEQIPTISIEDIKTVEGESRWQDIVGSEDSMEDTVLTRVLAEQIMSKVDNMKLSDICKQVIKLHYFEPQLNQSEIAKKIGCSRNNVSKVMANARKKLRPVVCTG